MPANRAERGGYEGVPQLCRDISQSLGEWQKHNKGRGGQRSGTWYRWPFTYVFTEHAAPSAIGATYHFSRISAERVDTGLHDFKGFYLDADGILIHVVEFQVDASAIDADRLNETVSFELEKGFTVPNQDDFVEVEHELRQGFLDGVTPL